MSTTDAVFPWQPNSGQRRLPLTPLVDATEHFRRQGVGPIEHTELDECPIEIRNIGWTLGNDCPYRCTHCYSMSAREKGMDFTPAIVDRVIEQLAANGVETVNLGGNEPLFTNGPNPVNTLLPRIIHGLADAGILVGLTTSGITLTHLERDHAHALARLNDVDVSFDSPYPDEHNANRGAKLFKQAVRALEICRDHGIPHSVIMCAMAWNFTDDRIDALVSLARDNDAHIRINPLKPVEARHMDSALPADQYYAGFSRLMAQCSPIDLGEPPLAAVTDFAGAGGCPCGRTSFRIHSITPDGRIPVSPCVYLHDYKVGDLVTDDLHDIVRSPQFQTFRRRNAHPEAIPGCAGCPLLASCRGGCAGRSYLHHAHTTGQRSLFVQDPYCPVDIAPTAPFPTNPTLPTDQRLVHMDYLCTWIGKPLPATSTP
ncbi:MULTISPECIES: radical SAM/SPASM domain-containing protein [Actinoalloteichus]|uniref:Radical SAM additional 4Fe4S-binding SPASM domain n=1 Tax=Actinoalloteichus fjordicus TaxID=1612552 RepID=A0AAC9PSJ6_9PSEU|nr:MULTISPECIES: radical SAM protein [Actinoalloteichus]APU15080.1 radical SAM additional 4Fe4S-binding SPASM domain [Actinoalloteichus fjordicus]APU21149.1 radical SAM additional 4Fe4S-binding SPASM domain [Actinoalloteichus sp. GBA129-24]